MQRPKAEPQPFAGKRTYLAQRAEQPCAALCTLSVDSHLSAGDTPRYPLGGEPARVFGEGTDAVPALVQVIEELGVLP